MKTKFIATNNVRSLYKLADTLNSKSDNTPGLGLCYGQPGLGKTEGAIRLAVTRDYIYMRAKTAWTVLWFLQDLLRELEEQEIGVTKKAYDRVKEVLLKRPRLILIDEVDHMLHDGRVIETCRDLHDETGNPFLLIGMQDAERKLKRYPHLYDRFADVVRVEPVQADEIMRIADELCEVPISEAAAKEVFKRTNGTFRKIITILNRAEQFARQNSLEQITPRLLSNGSARNKPKRRTS